MIDKRIYEQVIDEVFCPLLTRFAFIKTGSETNDYGYTLTYQNSTTGLSIDIETGWAHVFVSLFKLTDGNLPEFMLVQADEDDIPLGLAIEQVMQRRKPAYSVWQGGQETTEYARRFTADELRRVLMEYESILSECATDILSGDFSLLQEFKGTTPTFPPRKPPV